MAKGHFAYIPFLLDGLDFLLWKGKITGHVSNREIYEYQYYELFSGKCKQLKIILWSR